MVFIKSPQIKTIYFTWCMEFEEVKVDGFNITYLRFSYRDEIFYYKYN